MNDESTYDQLVMGVSSVHMQEKTSDDIPMPGYFRFLALLAFKIFAAEQVAHTVSCHFSLFPFLWFLPFKNHIALENVTSTIPYIHSTS